MTKHQNDISSRAHSTQTHRKDHCRYNSERVLAHKKKKIFIHILSARHVTGAQNSKTKQFADIIIQIRQRNKLSREIERIQRNNTSQHIEYKYKKEMEQFVGL